MERNRVKKWNESKIFEKILLYGEKFWGKVLGKSFGFGLELTFDDVLQLTFSKSELKCRSLLLIEAICAI